MKARTALQAGVAVAGLVPVTAGLAGVVRPDWLAMAGTPSSLTHTAYLSGLLLGIGLAFWSAIPRIETRGARFALLTTIVALGGLARLTAALRLGVFTPSVTLPLVMELGVTPAIFLWQRHIARTFPHE